MLLYGASGHAKVVASILKAMDVEVEAVFDDDSTKKQLGTIPVIGGYKADFESDQGLIIAIGYNSVRAQVAALIQHRFGTAVHPSALVDASVRIGEGTVLMQGAIVQADTRIGRHVIINTAATIDHDCQLGDFVHIAPGATLCGGIQVGTQTLIGAGSVVAPNLTIGAHCVIGAGSVVTKSIPDGSTVWGNPAKVTLNK